MTEADPPIGKVPPDEGLTDPPVGAWVWDTKFKMVGIFVGRSGENLMVRPPNGTNAWPAPRSDLEVLTEAEAKAAKARHAAAPEEDPLRC
ncbi:hypothetical protein [Streptomyces aidingensis]|uniref:Uncharacterized protein n=1 Tax=Streptomyces aidingensis TaxID=910347 RepID=A0A1I1M6V8_9ACTN|nr:hypothetical protein [Streptomyces aidingensis]SFC78313.1 hypothetical protein SAMN05421773_10624 [Streptomyces aidingensis]